MSRTRLRREQTVLLRAIVGEAKGVERFAEAVVAHLTNPPAASSAPEDVIARLSAVLAGAMAEEEFERAVGLLSDDPELLASVFQNADLLEPGAGETRRIAALVAETLERVGGGGA
jgi:hypothetical protein